MTTNNCNNCRYAMPHPQTRHQGACCNEPIRAVLLDDGSAWWRYIEEEECDGGCNKFRPLDGGPG